MTDRSDHFILICTTCQGAEAATALRKALVEGLPADFAIRPVACMASCDRPTTVGLQAPGKAQYLFGDIQSDREIRALAEFAWQYRDSADGWTNATDRPAALYDKTLSRLPALTMESQA